MKSGLPLFQKFIELVDLLDNDECFPLSLICHDAIDFKRNFQQSLNLFSHKKMTLEKSSQKESPRSVAAPAMPISHKLVSDMRSEAFENSRSLKRSNV